MCRLFPRPDFDWLGMHRGAVRVVAGTAFMGVALLASAGATRTNEWFTPAGSGAVTSNGDYVSAAAGLNVPYRYYIEVPPALSRLVIDLFDADIGAGGSGEAGSGQTGRDRARGSFNTTAVYRLFDPSGAPVATSFTTGNTTSPSGADNAWLTFYDSDAPGSAVPFGGASSEEVEAATSLEVAFPAGVATDDLLIGVIALNEQNDVDTPSGWDLVGQGNCPGATTTCRLEVFSQKYASGSSVTFAWTGTAKAEGAVLRYTSISGTPTITYAAATGTSAAPTSPSVAAGANSIVLRIMAASDNELDGTPFPTAHDGRYAEETGGDGGDLASAAADRFQTTAGATGTAAFDLDASENWRAVTLAIPVTVSTGSPANGHWLLEVDMSSAATAGDDLNAVGIRAHDGDSGSGGTELPVYFDSHANFGVNPPASGTVSRTYTEHAFITSGCACYENDFDYDTDQDAIGSISFTSRTGDFSQTFGAVPLSDNDAWARNQVQGWTSDAAADDYGVWTNGITIASYINLAGQNGNYTNFYASSFEAVPPPPGDNPTADAFRVYLATDAGTAPVKPYLGQFVSWVSGPQTPTVGQTTVVRVTVRMDNPTGLPIVFSTPSNLITANVPGAGAVYGGSAQASQGSVTAQPSVGGTGDVVWNPGTLAAATTATLSYLVEVTPTSAGQRIPVTATPASGNGTRAQYVDETGNTTQSRSTYLFGPLCELALTEDVITPAVVTGLRAYRDGGETTVEWQTASEVAVDGFEVYRVDPATDEMVRVTEQLVPGLQEAPQGGLYRVPDDGAPAAGELTYVVVEYESGGGVRAHGPFAVAAEDGSPAGDRELRAPRMAAADAGAGSGQRRLARAQAISWPPLPKPKTVMVGVRSQGIHLLSATAIGEALGIHPLAIRAAIGTGILALTNRGQEIPWDRAPGDGGIVFWGEAIDSNYSRDNVYWLRVGRGTRMGTASVTAPGGAGSASFETTVTAETDTFAGTLVATDPDSDYWFWSYLTQGSPINGTRQFTVASPARAAAGTPRLRTYLHGASETGVADEHEVVVKVNGNTLQTVSWSGITPYVAEAEVPLAWLNDGDNVITLEALLPPGVANGTVYVERFELTYERGFAAPSEGLEFTLASLEEAVVSGVGSGPKLLLDVTDPRHPRRVEGHSEPAPGSVGLRNRVGTARYAVASQSAWKQPAWVRRDSGRDPLLDAQGAAHVIVTTAPMMAAAQELADFRSGQGLASAVVDVASIYEKYSFGIPDPHAIRDFLADAAARPGSHLSYVVLAGAGSFDYRDLLGFNDSLVPPLLTASEGGLFAADSLFGDLAGDDGVPELAVGRIAARTPSELSDYITKMTAYEQAADGPWLRRALVIADDPEGGVDFGDYGDRIAGALGGNFAGEKIYLGTVGDAAARTQTLAALDSGLGMACFVGHGGVDRITSEGVLLESDVPALTNAGRAPIMSALTCTINRFEVPGFPCLGAVLTNFSGGGAAAVYAPSGLSDNAEATRLGEHVVRRLTSPAAVRVGDVVRAAETAYLAEGGKPSLVRLYNQLGDPALRVRHPGSPSGTPGSGPVE